MNIPNYIMGKWTPHEGPGIKQINAITGELIGTVGNEGIDFAKLLDYGRSTGGPALRKMSFRQRGLMLKKLALFLHGIRKKLD